MLDNSHNYKTLTLETVVSHWEPRASNTLYLINDTLVSHISFKWFHAFE